MYLLVYCAIGELQVVPPSYIRTGLAWLRRHVLVRSDLRPGLGTWNSQRGFNCGRFFGEEPKLARCGLAQSQCLPYNVFPIRRH